MAVILRECMAGPGTSLVLNAGSSSVKFRFYEGDRTLIGGVIDGIGGTAKVDIGTTSVMRKVPDYNEAGRIILETLAGRRVDKIIHRVTHGEYHDKPAIVTPAMIAELKLLIPLSPLHLPASIDLMTFFMARTRAKHIACFDTMFHRTLPDVAKLYAIPQDIARKHGIYRYGFHGIAHEAMLLEAQRLAGRKFDRVITCQLGNGASVCAIKDGKSIDTSMGLTPLEGLAMGTRSGDIDPAVVIYLAHHAQMTPEEVLELLEKKSGLKGLAGDSDVRKLLERELQGDKHAALALDIFAYRTRKYIGAYIAALGGVDCIVLSGGIPRAPKMRERILTNLEEFGIILNSAALQQPMPVQLSSGKVVVWAIEVDEQEHMRRITEKM
jgi:acetate kinase